MFVWDMLLEALLKYLILTRIDSSAHEVTKKPSSQQSGLLWIVR